MRQVFLLIAHFLAEDDELGAISEHCLRQIRFIQLHLHRFKFLLEVFPLLCAWHEQGELRLLNHLDGFVEIPVGPDPL